MTTTVAQAGHRSYHQRQPARDACRDDPALVLVPRTSPSLVWSCTTPPSYEACGYQPAVY
jgi:hypothetical protein